jgi:hypothetical protein
MLLEYKLFSCVNNSTPVGFEVFTAVSMEMAVFWVVAPCSLVELYQFFQRSLLPPSSGRFAQTTRCYNPEDNHLQFNTPLTSDFPAVFYFAGARVKGFKPKNLNGV